VNVDSLAQKTEGFSGSDLKREFHLVHLSNVTYLLTNLTDLCVSAALDSVKEHMDVPWSSRHHVLAPSLSSPLLTTKPLDVVDNFDRSRPPSDPTSKIETSLNEQDLPEKSRILHLHNFSQALKEITPSSSETLGSLADLRRWNEEFGEGRRDRKKRQVWGKGQFGFVNNSLDTLQEGRVANP